MFGGSKMEFIGAIIETIIKMMIVGAVAFGGIIFGKNLRKRKEQKNS